ncbi:uncharacterized protein LY89DRAFT_192370 [Mollisia scopiformis]|uniref:Uncharacterized protein n=1 Tax=Mollisia scopiformis TaxID=149040 RepID=A0A194WXR1_MOLSC|nr:uncharacterized protein LY89DRAFT_192370 [Mollisia scopiformis]KUJ12763.1 hypothetical protein LY89DRAFT_192370 [Mollisia scopiformis]
MDAASSTAADMATATVPSATASATSVASNFGWLSITEVFWITVLYVWYMFLFIVCFAIVCGGIWLVCMAVFMLFQFLAKHGPGLYSNSRERLEQYWEASRERYVKRQSGGRGRSEPDDVQMDGFEIGEENKVRSKFGKEDV